MAHNKNCIFCDQSELEIVAENDLAFAIRDKFPVKPLHTLIIPKRHVQNVFDTTELEREAIHRLALDCLEQIKLQDSTVGGVNYGSNVGAVAGQKIFHAHVHLIPRRAGDMPPPPAQE